MSGKGISSTEDVLSSHSPNHGGQWAGLIAITADPNPEGERWSFPNRRHNPNLEVSKAQGALDGQRKAKRLVAGAGNSEGGVSELARGAGGAPSLLESRTSQHTPELEVGPLITLHKPH